MTAQVAIISRIPRLGASKRRLARTVGENAALAFHRAFLQDELSSLRAAGFSPCIVHDPIRNESESQAFRELAGGATCISLQGGKLAADLLAGFERLCPKGPTVIVSSDVPHLPGAAVSEAVRLLREVDVVLGPCPDGGYWLVAMNEPHDIFSGVPMGTDSVIRETRARIEALGLSLAEVDSLQDVDEVSDFAAVATELPRDGATCVLLAKLLRQPSAGLELPPPTRLHIELTNRCNSTCSTCVRTFTPDAESDLSLDQVAQVLDGIPVLESVALQVNGEAMLYDGLAEAIRLVKERGARADLNTNGIALRGARARVLFDEGLDCLNVSLDAASAAVHKRLRGVDAFEQVVGNVRDFVTMRGERELPWVSLWMTATRHNLGEIVQFVQLAGDLGVDEVHLQRLVYFEKGTARSEDSVHGRLTDDDEALLAEATTLAAELGVAFKACGRHHPKDMLRPVDDPAPWRGCSRPWQKGVVMANGDLVPCCLSIFYTNRERLLMGNVLDSGWSEVWNNAVYNEQRAAMLAGEGPDFCAGCGLKWSL